MRDLIEFLSSQAYRFKARHPSTDGVTPAKARAAFRLRLKDAVATCTAIGYARLLKTEGFRKEGTDSDRVTKSRGTLLAPRP